MLLHPGLTHRGGEFGMLQLPPRVRDQGHLHVRPALNWLVTSTWHIRIFLNYILNENEKCFWLPSTNAHTVQIFLNETFTSSEKINDKNILDFVNYYMCYKHAPSQFELLFNMGLLQNAKSDTFWRLKMCILRSTFLSLFVYITVQSISNW
jgi:hypothetical protein